MENHSKTTQLICISHPCVGEWYFEVEKKNEHFFSISKKQCGKGGFEYFKKIEKYNKDHNEILCVATVTFTDGSTGSYYVEPKIYKTRYKVVLESNDKMVSMRCFNCINYFHNI